jgi:hypothetical protein
MHSARLWTGVLVITGLAVPIILALVPSSGDECSRVQGTVTYHGDPVTEGAIFFVAEQGSQRDSTHAAIDKDGHYRCDPDWPRNPGPGTRYRIYVMLNPEKYPPPGPAPAEAPESNADNGILGPDAKIRMAALASGRARQAALKRPEGDAPNAPVREQREHRFSSPLTTDLAVRLGPEPARVDVELSD